MKKVVILESLGIPEEELEKYEKAFENEVEFAEYEKTTDVDILKEETKDADAMIIANMPMPDEVIEACDRLQFINVAFTGVDHVGLKAAKEKGIKVSNASGYSNEAVAELAVGMAIGMLRNIPQVQERVRSGGTKDGLVGSELRNKTVGIVGYGKIGSRSGELFHAFGCKILACSRTMHPEYPNYVKQVSLDDLLKESDIVILHCPLNDSTRGLIDYEKLCLMKKTAILINLARGPVTNENDLACALSEGIIAGAAIDVYTKEPPLPADTQMLKAPNTLLTPHIAFATKESMSLRAEIVFDNLRAWLDGGQLNKVI
ncbi:MAG: hydroxyacid dehydrogenase [Erysipelotrichaceae bacterium]|nr:hydroxyacid dehydrogenase [Erysipelotrichaceae bacterium]